MASAGLPSEVVRARCSRSVYEGRIRFAVYNDRVDAFLPKKTNDAVEFSVKVGEEYVGPTPEAVVVKCGPHQIKIGSAGTARSVDVPCGGELSLH